MRKRFVIVPLALVLFAFLVMACAPGSGASRPGSAAGFFTGVWHGWIAPFCLVWGLLNPAIRIYEPINTGWWYDFGFYIAVISGFGSLSLLRRRKTAKPRR